MQVHRSRVAFLIVIMLLATGAAWLQVHAAALTVEAVPAAAVTDEHLCS